MLLNFGEQKASLTKFYLVQITFMQDCKTLNQLNLSVRTSCLLRKSKLGLLSHLKRSVGLKQTQVQFHTVHWSWQAVKQTQESLRSLSRSQCFSFVVKTWIGLSPTQL